ncbi:ShlB/FhaC/HecB family hemolysin secretion/activation protein [Stenotrophomonas panacihumi]|nr:ShlB/FhaC/HecB family hemolysin secretion/activation protein [Stenotrophomonas panacihumi]
MRRNRRIGGALSAALSLVAFGGASPLQAQPAEPAAQLQRQQEERERQLREQLEVPADVRRDDGWTARRFKRLPAMPESPCFHIARIVLAGEGSTRFNWALKAASPRADRALGRCLGTTGINVVIARVQDAVVARGYITTRVLAGPQDLTTGTLVLTVVPGHVRAVRFAGPAPRHASLRNAVPAGAGALLNLRDVEQGLENLQRVPSATADIRIEPAQGDTAGPGDSTLVVAWSQRRPWRGSVSIDDAGSQATGKLQANATLARDNPLGWHDLFYLNAGHDVFNGSGKGSGNWTAHYDVPLRRWLFGATAGGYDYRQTVAGAFEDYVYRGRSDNTELRASLLLHRNARSRLNLYGYGWRRAGRHYIDDTEVRVQRRATAGWAVGLEWRQFIGEGSLEAGMGYRRGTGAFHALHAPEEAFGEGSSRMRLLSADARLSMPFRLGKQSLRYLGSWRAQWNHTALVPQDRFAIGGRYSVRGFDGEISLTGDRGWWLRNEAELALGGGQAFYLGLDYGHVAGGAAVRWQPGDHLAGAAIGLRGRWRALAWDGFFATPVSKPDRFPTPPLTTGVSVSAVF